MSGEPLAILVAPLVYDFALHDLYLKPFGLLRIGRWLAEAGYRVELVNCLDYREARGGSVLGGLRRRSDGTGKLPRRRVEPPAALAGIKRGYARYGLDDGEIMARLRAAAGGKQPDLVLVGSGMTYWYPGVIETVRLIRSVWPRACVVLGGVYATLCASHAKGCVDADLVVSGPGEIPLRGFLEECGLPVPHGSMPVAPMVHEVFRDAGIIRLSTGCPFSCRYCSSRRLEGDYAPGDPEIQLRHLSEVAAIYGTRTFAFYDDALLYSASGVLVPFLERVIDLGVDARFYVPNGVHVELLDRALARLMHRAGFQEIRMGFESSSDTFHAGFDTKLQVESLRHAVAAAQVAGFRPGSVGVYLLVGLPGQRYDEVERSIDYAVSCGVRVGLAEYSPIPGTQLWEESVRQSSFDLATEPLFHNNSILPMRRPGFGLRELQTLKERTLRANRLLG